METEFVTFDTELLVNVDQGVKGTTDEYGGVEEEGDLVIAVTLKVPKALFEPLKVKVEIPHDFIPGNVTEGQVEAIEIPVTPQLEAAAKGVLQEHFRVTGPRTILGQLKRFFSGSE